MNQIDILCFLCSQTLLNTNFNQLIHNCSILRSMTDTLQTNTKSFGSRKTKQPLGRCLTVSSSKASKQVTRIEGIRALYPTASKHHLLLLLIDVERADCDPEIVSAFSKLTQWVINPSKPEFLINTSLFQQGPEWHWYFNKICITNIKGRLERIAENLISALTQQNHLWAWSLPAGMLCQPGQEQTVKSCHREASCSPRSSMHTLIFSLLHQILPIFMLPGIKSVGGKINCLWQVVTILQWWGWVRPPEQSQLPALQNTPWNRIAQLERTCKII